MNTQTPLSLVGYETSNDRSLDFHPKTLNEYQGQSALKEKLTLYITAAQMRNEPLDHLLLFGPPGLGKTTLATIIARTLDAPLTLCSGPTLERTGDLVALLSALPEKGVLFIDEIHRMPLPVEEVLYSGMEHFRVDVIMGQGVGAQSISLPIAPFTLIGATTKPGLISAPLRSRFGITERLMPYNKHELAAIILSAATHLGLSLSSEGALRIAEASRATPRIAKKIVRRVRDIAQVKNNNYADDNTVHTALSFLGIDHDGLTEIDRKILTVLIERYRGGPAGLETIAALVGEDPVTIEDVYEPFLMHCGYLERTQRGRQIPYHTLPELSSRFGGQQIFVGR
jgi:holliday junction DNA helicase RuvB